MEGLILILATMLIITGCAHSKKDTAKCDVDNPPIDCLWQ